MSIVLNVQIIYIETLIKLYVDAKIELCRLIVILKFH